VLVTFDFDDTLCATNGVAIESGVARAQGHLARGDRVLVVTSRRFSADSQEEIHGFLEEHGLAGVRIIHVGDDKGPTLLELESGLHYDDDPHEVRLCEQLGVPCVQVEVPRWALDVD
jgi:hypothetical protein